MSRALRIAAGLIATIALVTLGAAAPARQDSPTLEAARVRWEKLSPEQKQRARAAYEHYRAMSEEERQELAERAHRIQETRERVERELSPAAREKLERLEPEKRRALMNDLVEGEAREIGQRIRRQLPDNWRERLERGAPEERAQIFEQFKSLQRERVARMAIEQIGRRLRIGPEEVRRMQELPMEERATAVLELRKRLSEQDAREFGLLPGITPEEWDAWQRLPPEEFFERIQRYRHERALHPDAPGDARGQPGIRPPWAERLSPERREKLRRLFEAVAERRQDQFEFAELNAAEREARVMDRKRQRCIAAIREGGLLTDAEFADLVRRDNHEFFEVVRKLLRPVPPPEAPQRRP